MPTKNQNRKKGGARKVGRDQDKCARYKNLGIREANKKRKVEKERKRQKRLKERKNALETIRRKDAHQEGDHTGETEALV